MSVEQRLPRGEIAARVRRELANGVQSYHEISRRTHIPINTVAHAASDFYSRGKLPQPDIDTLAMRKQEHIDAIGEARGGLWSIIRPYAHLGMWGTEIEELVLLVDGIKLNHRNINHTLTKSRGKGYIPRPIHATTHAKDVKRGISRHMLLLWLDSAAVIIEEGNGSQIPATTTRGRWMGLASSFADGGIASPQLARWEKILPQWIKICRKREMEVKRKRLIEARSTV